METATATLTEFLLARIAQDEGWAKVATPGPWTQSSAYGHVDVMRHPYTPGDDMIAQGVDAYDATYITVYDPTRVLAECEAKRRIVAEHPDYGGYGNSCATCAESDIDLAPWPCPTLRALGAIYVGHHDYRDDWKP